MNSDQLVHITFTVTTDLTFDQRMERICTVLSENGYNVKLIGRKKKNSYPVQPKAYQQKRLKCIFQKGVFFYAEYNLRLFFYLLFTKTDIISSADIDSALPGLLVSKLRSKKFVFDAHEYFTEVVELVNRPLVKKIWNFIEGFVIKRTSYAYTVSEGLRIMFWERYHKKFEVVRNIPLTEHYPEEPKMEKYFVYAGAVNEGRGLEELIGVWPEVNAKLYICGDGDVLEELKTQVRKMNLTEKIIFFGYTQPAEMRRIIRGAYAGVLLLRKESLSYYYSLANKFFDYIHAGIPQLTIDFPEYKTLNQQYEVACLCSLDKEEIKKGIEKLLNNSDYYNVLKENTRKAAAEWNWEKESEKLITIYNKVSEA